MTNTEMQLRRQEEVWQACIDRFMRTELGTATPEQVKAIKDHSHTYMSQVFGGLEKELRDRGYKIDRLGNERPGKENARSRSASRSAKKDSGKSKEGAREDAARRQMLRERCASLKAEVQDLEAERSSIEERVTKKLRDDPSFTDVSELETGLKEVRSQMSRSTEDVTGAHRQLPIEKVKTLLERIDAIKNIQSFLEEGEALLKKQGKGQNGFPRDQIVAVPPAKPTEPVFADHWHLLQHIDRVGGLDEPDVQQR